MNRQRFYWILRVVFALIALVVIAVQRYQLIHLGEKAAVKPPAKHEPAVAMAQPAQILALNNPDLARILAIPDKLERLRALLDFTKGLNAADLCTVLKRLVAEPATLKGDNNLALSILVARLVELDPAGTLVWANTQLTGPARRQVLDALFDAWSSLDPAAAFAALNKITNVSERAAFEHEAFQNMAGRDPGGALKILLSLPIAEQTHENYSMIFTTWAANDPAAASAAVLALAPSRNRDFAIENVLAGWAQADPRGALAWAAQLPGGVRASALSTALGNLAQQDPQAAVDYINTLANPSDRNNLLGVVATNWGLVDPTAALAWVDQNTTGQPHDLAMLNLMVQLSQTDPTQAASLLDHLPANMQNGAITQIANNWATQDIKAAMSWVQGQAGDLPGAQIKNLEVNMINNLTNVNPAQAAAYVQTIQDNPLFGRLVEQVAANWVAADPQAAMAWANSLPMDQGGSNAMLQVITQYTNKDPQAAWQMAANLPDGDLKNQTMANVIGKMAPLNPAMAAPLIASLPDATQVTSTNQVAQAWLNQDPTAAEQWINTSELSPSHKIGGSQPIKRIKPTQRSKPNTTQSFDNLLKVTPYPPRHSTCKSGPLGLDLQVYATSKPTISSVIPSTVAACPCSRPCPKAIRAAIAAY